MILFLLTLGVKSLIFPTLIRKPLNGILQSTMVLYLCVKPVTDGCDLERDLFTFKNRIIADVKCPVLIISWALGLMVQGKNLALPPMRMGSNDGSGDLPAHPDTQLPWHWLSPKLKSLLNKSTSL